MILRELHPRPGREELHRAAAGDPRPELRARVTEELARHRSRGDDCVHQVGEVFGEEAFMRAHDTTGAPLPEADLFVGLR